MTAELFVNSNLDGVLDAIGTSMGLECRIGAAEDARTGAPPRVVWVPAPKAARKYTITAQQRPEAHFKHVHDVAALFSVHLWADSYAAAEDLERRLETALYNVLSPNGYELEDGEQVGDSAPTGSGQTWLFVVPVRLLRIPIPVETFVPTKLATITAPLTLRDAIGGTPTTGPNAGATVP